MRCSLFMAALVAVPLFTSLLIGCAPPSTNRQSLKRRDSQEATLAITGTWVCRESRSFPVEWGWGNATSCNVRIRRLTSHEKEMCESETATLPSEVVRPPLTDMCYPGYPERTQVDVVLWLSDSKKQWVAPDTIPGWIGPDGNMRLGSYGSCLTFKPTLRKDGRLVLKHEALTLTFERQEQGNVVDDQPNPTTEQAETPPTKRN